MTDNIYEKFVITEQLLLVLTGKDIAGMTKLESKKRVLLMQSAWNAVVDTASRIGCDAAELAMSLEDILPDIPQILAHALETYNGLREIATEAEFEYDPHVWDPEQGLPGHTEKMIKTALDAFPVKIEYQTLGQRQMEISEKMANLLSKSDNEEAQQIAEEFKSIIKKT